MGLNREPELCQRQMMQFVTGYFCFQAICVAAKLNIADILKDGPKTAKEISKVVKADADSLYRLLRALAGVGIFIELDKGRFGLTPLAATLQKDNPDSLQALFFWLHEKPCQEAWSHLLYSVKTGKNAFEYAKEKEFFKYLSEVPETRKAYEVWMSQALESHIPHIINNYDFSSFQSVVDVGGGYGGLLEEILKKYTHLNGLLFDTPHVIKATRKNKAGISNRLKMLSGNFLKTIPKGGDIYILKSILHNWNDNLAVKILKNCCRAMGKESRLLLVEMIVPNGNNPHLSKFMDLNMMIFHRGGRGRSEVQYKELLAQAGFKARKIIKTCSSISLMEATSV